MPAEHIDLPAGHTDLPAHPADLPPTAPPSAAELQPAWPQGTELMVTARGIQPAGAVAPSGRPWRGKALWLAATLLLIAGIAFALWPLSPVGPAGQQRTMEIAPHSTVKEIAAQLQAGDFIRSRFAFPILVRLMGVERDLRAGTYLLPTGVWAWTVVEELHRGQVHTRSVTIPEGLTLREVATLLEQEGLVSSTRFIKEARDPELLAQLGVHAPSAEGFLFPETYTLALGLKERDILRVMVEQFFTRLRAIPGGDNLSGEELLAKVTLASLVEREAKSPGEQGRIAGVFSNRLKKDLRLESCATVQYILGEPKARLRLSDIRIESPYNTYLNEGLPPGPIANPGAGALAAALNPEEHDYLFFVARGDGTGRHIFTRSFEAHQAAQQRMRTN